jgi:hypothetical protein
MIMKETMVQLLKKCVSMCVLLLIPFLLHAGTKDKQRNDKLTSQYSKITLNQDYATCYGLKIKVWTSNRGCIGINALGDQRGGCGENKNMGMEYPPGQEIEHLYGGGVWVGARTDTGRTGQQVIGVTVAYEGWSGTLFEMYGNPDGRDSFYYSSRDEYTGNNRRGFDDDGDGKIDEDELDGLDNDGDWNPLTDDLGVDGLPDSLEIGCKGEFDPQFNPDPAFDNWDSTARDLCKSRNPFKSNRLVYTQNNGYPNHGEPHVDEDYGTVSELDMYFGYSDTNKIGGTSVPAGHTPLGLAVWQRMFSWQDRIKEPIIPLEFYYINVGRKTWDSVWVGFFADWDIGPISAPGYFTRNSSGYFADVRTAYASNVEDRPSTPIGVTVLQTPKSLDSIRYTFQWFPGQETPNPDVPKYNFMALGQIKPDEFPSISDTRFIFAFGPFDKVYPGDTLKVVLSLVSGEGVKEGRNNLHDNAARALELYYRGWTAPPVPPSPPLKITKLNDRVILNWKWERGDPRFDPLQTWDDSNYVLNFLDSTHWRRIHPDSGINPDIPLPGFPRKGGRIFEGFRIWRSVSPELSVESFALLRQVDVGPQAPFFDSLGFEYGTGLEYTLIDSGLVRGRPYWYAVTSFSIPGLTIIEQPDSSGLGTYLDTLISPPTESSIEVNAQKVVLPFEPSREVGKVKVVPNPYRTDHDYTFEAGGWEGLSRKWTENDRVIWFIHLPPKCTIRIFSLSGDLIRTIEHDDQLRQAANQAANSDVLPVGQEEWNLISESGRAIASGIYVYTVESDFGRQIGKFVVIR